MVNFFFKRKTQKKTKKKKKKKKKSALICIMNHNIFIIRGIFRIVEYPNVGRCLHPSLCEIAPRHNHVFAKRSFLDHFRCLAAYEL